MIELRRVELGFDWCQLNFRSENWRASKFVIRARKEGYSDSQDKTVKFVKDKVFVHTRNAVVKLQESVSFLPHNFRVKFLPFCQC